MKIVSPSVELLSKGDNSVSFVAKCARVCYDRETGNDEKTYNNLIKDGHWSVFRHASYYAIVPINFFTGQANDSYSNTFFNWLTFLLASSSYKDNIIGINVIMGADAYYVAYNGNYALDNPDFHESMQSYLVSPEEFAKHAPELMRYTFRCITQDSIAKELNRVSPNNITEMSTRYVDLENGAICKPHWMKDDEVELWNNNRSDLLPLPQYVYLHSCAAAFRDYATLINNCKMKREDARGVLTKDTATKVIYTYNVKEWRHIIELRTSERAHPNAQIIANMIKDELIKLGYDF